MDLLRAIDRVLEPYGGQDRKPPFSLAELVIMSLADGREALQHEIVGWICDHSRYYRSLAYSSFADVIDAKRDIPPDEDVVNLGSAFYKVHKMYGVPLYLRPARTSPDGLLELDRYYTIPHQARIYLKDCILAQYTRFGYQLHHDHTVFPWFKLPAEIRNTIYDLVFRIDGGGVLINTGTLTCTIDRHAGHAMNPPRGTMYVLPETSNSSMAIADWKKVTKADQFLEVGTVKEHLSRTMVSHEFRKESMHAFYAINTFLCWDVAHLQDFLKKVPRPYKAHLARIAFCWWRGDYLPLRPRNADPAFKLLAELPKLKVLYIDAQDSFLQTKRVKLNAQGVMTRAGLGAVKKVKVSDKVVFNDALEVTQEFLRKALLPKKPKPLKPRAPRKKKATTAIKNTTTNTTIITAVKPKPKLFKVKAKPTSVFGGGSTGTS